uniref:Cuticular protein n=1 Tax=Papilio xuthus TaxID=66420 RepID=I4DLP3_PAPXU|nr:unknown secreted protein [Papilio xuthus]
MLRLVVLCLFVVTSSAFKIYQSDTSETFKQDNAFMTSLTYPTTHQRRQTRPNHFINKRSINFDPPKSYVPATPYASSFYAPPTLRYSYSSPLLPKGPFVSAYTAPAHYINKRLSYLPQPSIFSSVVPSSFIPEFSMPLYVIKKRDIPEIKE